jgi:N-acetylneuraminate synthase
MNGKKKDTSNYVKIGGTFIGEDYPTYIIAEIGINHNGSMEKAIALIDEASAAGVNAVKFQKRNLESLYIPDVLSNTDKYEQNYQYMIPVLKKVEFSEPDIIKLKEYAEALGLDFLCTPFDVESADFLEKIGVKAFKISSADLNNLFLIEHIAGFGKPMIVSTGMSYWDEIERTVQLITSKKVPFVLLHCRSSYPVWPREVNLKMIRKLAGFGVPVGYSGHDIGIIIPLIAASMGACVIEKHITLNRHMTGPDHKISLEPFELRRLVRDIHIADQAMGKNNRFLLRGEILNRELFGKSLAAARNIAKGEVLTKQMLKVIGPAKGIAPSCFDRLIGKTSPRDFAENEFFKKDDFELTTDTASFKNYRSDWGLIVRYDDIDQFIDYSPKFLEFHFTYNDLIRDYIPEKHYSQNLVVHAPEYFGDKLLDLCSFDETIRKKSVEIINATIEKTKFLSRFFNTATPKVIAHPGAMSLNIRLDRETLKNNLIKSLNEINAADVELLMENLPPYPWYFGGQWKGNYFMNGDQIKLFCEETNSKICFDLSHAFLYCNSKKLTIADYIRTVLPYISHIHFADGYGLDGEGVQIGEGDIDFKSIMPFFSGYNGTWVPEIWRGHLDKGKGFIEALKRLSEFAL